jgi:hypothetical protein
MSPYEAPLCTDCQHPSRIDLQTLALTHIRTASQVFMSTQVKPRIERNRKFRYQAVSGLEFAPQRMFESAHVQFLFSPNPPHVACIVLGSNFRWIASIFYFGAESELLIGRNMDLSQGIFSVHLFL